MRSGSEPTGKVPFPICLRTQIATPDDVNQVNAGFTMEISSATLTFFLPGTAATPASPSKAWLIFPGSGLPYQNQRNTNEWLQRALPTNTAPLGLHHHPSRGQAHAGRAHRTRRARRRVRRQRRLGLMCGDYHWEVPATTRLAALEVHLPAELGAQAGYYGDRWAR